MEQPLNILFILTDQMRWDCMSGVEHPVVQTPHLDMLAAGGAAFTSAYSPCPSCIAARASIWTGLTPSSHHRLGYRDRVPWRYDNMLPRVLGDAGYQTHCVGKTHFYPQRAHCGFDSLESYENEQNFTGLFVNDYHDWLEEKTNGRMTGIDHGLTSNGWITRPSPLPEELHNNTWVATRGIDFLRRRDPTRPFFLNLSFHRPHPPIDPPQSFWDEYKDRPLPPVPVGDWAHKHDRPITGEDDCHGRLDPAYLDRARRAYYAQVAHIDSQIGRVLRGVSKHRCGPTAIIFTSDHGEMLGDHHMFRKTYAYEGSAAVPFVLQVPGRPAVGVCDAPVALQDVYPTCLELAGLTVPDTCEGRSLLPHLSDTPDAAPRRDYVHGEHSACYDASEAMQFLTDGKEKYIWFTTSGDEQIFDLANDPAELFDLSQSPDHAERLALWRSRLIDELARRPEDGLVEQGALKPGATPAVRDVLLEEQP